MLQKGLTAKRESKYVEFKEEFDPASTEAMCELIKDMVAIANSGGGVIIIGLRSNGTTAGTDVSGVIGLDPAVMTDRVYKYTGYQFNEFEIIDCEKDGAKLAAIRITEVDDLIVFQDSGNYVASNGKQKHAFTKGAVYFRHGAKSEPCNADDLRAAVERRVEKRRRAWMTGVRKVFQAPDGSQVVVVGAKGQNAGPASKPAGLANEVVQSNAPGATGIRIVTDPRAPVYRLVDSDQTHPYRQKEVISEFKKALPNAPKLNQYDLRAAKKVYRIEENPAYCNRRLFGSAQYSREFVDWLIGEYKNDDQFFVNARDRFSTGAF